MTNFDKLITDIETLENQAYSAEFDTSKFLLSEKEVVKKILKAKNPSLTDEEIAYIVDNPDEINKRYDEKTNKEELKKKKTKKNKEDKKKETEEEKAKREKQIQEEKERKKKELQDKIQVYKDAFKDKLKAIYDEAKKILREVKEAIFQLVKDVKDLTKKFVTSTIQTFSSIPSIALLIAAPPWNVPAAISLAMLVVDVYLELLNRTKNIVPFLSPLRQLVFVTDKKNLSTLSAILNVPVKILLALWAPIMAIGKLVQKLIESLLNILKSRRSSVFKKATAKLRTLGHIPHNPESISVAGIELKPYGDRRPYFINNINLYAYSEEDAEEVADLLETFRINGNESNPSYSNKVVDYKTNFADELQAKVESLNDQLSSPDLNFPDSTGSENQSDGAGTSFVFDVELPDGSKLYGITEEQLEDLKATYNVVMQQLEVLEQSATIDDQKIIDDILRFRDIKKEEAKQKEKFSQVFATLESSDSVILANISDTNIQTLNVASISQTLNVAAVSQTLNVAAISTLLNNRSRGGGGNRNGGTFGDNNTPQFTQ